MKHFFLAPLIILFLMISCNEKDLPAPYGQFSNAVFVINEGPYPTGSGTITVYDRETGTVTQDIFETVNGRPLGNVVQSMAIYQDEAWIMVNNSNKIEVVNLEDFKSVATIENITLPRYFLGFDEGKGYVSCWDSTVKIINLADYSVFYSIKAGTGPDEMVLAGNYLFVINSGAYGIDSTVSVIRTDMDKPAGTIEVGHRPSGIRKDADGNIWVLCSGKGWSGFPAADDTPAKLVCIDPVSLEIVKEIIFPDNVNHPDNLIINGDVNILYYNHSDGIFAFPVAGSALNAQPFINADKMYYGMGFDDKTNMIYASDPLDYAQNGWVFSFNADDGSAVDSFLAGVIPNGFWFNQ